MKTTNSTLVTTAVFSDDGCKRYLLRKVWDSALPSLTIVMLFPSSASEHQLDSTTLLVTNNAARLGFGSVSIVNLFATLNDFSLSQAEDEDAENINVIITEAKKCDCLVYAPGVGKSKNPSFILRSTQVLEALKPYEKKLKCIGNGNGTAKFMHPLTPAVREWNLYDASVSDALGAKPKQTAKKKRPVGRPKKAEQ